jgi:hypothetical protein
VREPANDELLAEAMIILHLLSPALPHHQQRQRTQNKAAEHCAMPPRRFPPPWSIEDNGTGSAFVVKDASGQNLGYFYYEEAPVAVLIATSAKAIAFVDRRSAIERSNRQWKSLSQLPDTTATSLFSSRRVPMLESSFTSSVSRWATTRARAKATFRPVRGSNGPYLSWAPSTPIS